MTPKRLKFSAECEEIMKKQKSYYLLIWALTFIVFNVILFAVLPSSYTIAGVEFSRYDGSFWTGYAGIVVAFIGNLAVSLLFFARSENAEKAFLNMPLLQYAWGALIATFFVGAVIMAIQIIPNWLGALVCILILFFYAIAVIKALSAADAATTAGDKVKEKAAVMLTLTSDAEALIARAPNDEIRSECKNIYEALRYSDPMSDASLTDVEIRISAKLLDFADAVKSGKTEEVKTLASDLQGYIQDRNIKCKRLK